jgi:uncharacterized protein YceK
MHSRWLIVGLASIAAMALAACQTARSFDEGCPGIYSGLRYYGDQLDSLPPDGKIFFTLDLPLTTVADTLVLPFSAFAKPTRPQHGFLPGCTWAERR